MALAVGPGIYKSNVLSFAHQMNSKSWDDDRTVGRCEASDGDGVSDVDEEFKDCFREEDSEEEDLALIWTIFLIWASEVWEEVSTTSEVTLEVEEEEAKDKEVEAIKELIHFRLEEAEETVLDLIFEEYCNCKFLC